MKPPDGLIFQLRNTARMLMAGLYWTQKHAQKNQSDPKMDLAHTLSEGIRKQGKQGFSAWPVDVNQMLGWKRMALPADMPSIDGKSTPVISDLKPICNILRRQAQYRLKEVYVDKGWSEIRDYDEYDEADLEALKEALNLPATSVWGSPVEHAFYRPWHLHLNGPPLRILADMLMDFTFMLVSDCGIMGKRPVYGLHEHNPIAVCGHCDGLFLRTRADGEYCSKKCGAAAWSKAQGKEYFRQKQADYRATLKAQEERIKKNEKQQGRKKK